MKHEVDDFTLDDIYNETIKKEPVEYFSDLQQNSEQELESVQDLESEQESEPVQESNVQTKKQKRQYVTKKNITPLLAACKQEKRKLQNRLAAQRSREKKSGNILYLQQRYKQVMGHYPDFDKIISESGKFDKIKVSNTKRNYIKKSQLTDDIVEYKQQKRRLQNRLSASTYREKKRYYIDHLIQVINQSYKN